MSLTKEVVQAATQTTGRLIQKQNLLVKVSKLCKYQLSSNVTTKSRDGNGLPCSHKPSGKLFPGGYYQYPRLVPELSPKNVGYILSIC